jgi:hypothetical protein
MRDLSELNINEGGRHVARPSPSTEIISAFQARYGVTLPEDYLNLLRHSNGGHPELDSFGASPWAVNELYHLDYDRSVTDSLWVAMDTWRPILGNRALPFAEDGGGNQFFIDLATSKAAVKVCVHDDNFAIIDLAPSFQAFIDGLSFDPDYI